jgi:hypothetical protein
MPLLLIPEAHLKQHSRSLSLAFDQTSDCLDFSPVTRFQNQCDDVFIETIHTVDAEKSEKETSKGER